MKNLREMTNSNLHIQLLNLKTGENKNKNNRIPEYQLPEETEIE